MGVRLSRLVVGTSRVLERHVLSWIFGGRGHAALVHGPQEEDNETAIAESIQAPVLAYEGLTMHFPVAVEHGDVKIVAALIQAGADVNGPDSRGERPLCRASSSGRAEVVDLLLRDGADVNLANTDGETPLHRASSKGHAEVVDVLLRAGADIHRLDKDGYLPLHLALLRAWERGCTDYALKTLQVLVGHGAEWDETCEKIADQDLDWPFSMDTRPDTAKNDRWRETSPAIRLCLERWMQEYNHGLSLTDVPVEEVRNGIDATKTYLTEIAASNDVKIRYKICIVGPSGWGKTSLIKSLTQEKPSLVHIDDRTIGIDHFKMKFERRDEVLQAIKQHEVTFWDFAGQDAYQVAHSLFFSARTLYVVCIDLESFVTASMQAQLMTDTESEFYHWLNDFMEMKVLKWIRVICARQPDAQFIYVATKKDRVRAADLEDMGGALAILKGLLENVEVIVREMKTASETKVPIRDEHTVIGDRECDFTISYLGDPRLAAMVKKSSVRMLVTSCIAAKDVNVFKEQIQDAIVKSNRGYAMPDKYLRVLETILAMRTAAASLATDERLHNTFVPVNNLIKMLVMKLKNGGYLTLTVSEGTATDTLFTILVEKANDILYREEIRAERSTVEAVENLIEDYYDRMTERASVTPTDALMNEFEESMNDVLDRTPTKPYLDKATCRTIIQTLRDLGDILWYDTIDDEQLQNKIILDPMLMIDLVRQVFNHKRTAEIMTHYTLKELDFWKYLEGTDGMLSMKRVLQHFQLVYPMTSEMQADSDLIVPAYWQSNTCAFWMFGGGDLRFGKGIHREDIAVRAHWEFQFVNNYPHTLFDNVVVASCSASYKRDVGPDWIMYMEKDKYACRLVLQRALYSHHWILHLEAIQGTNTTDKQEKKLWDCFLLLSTSLEKVIRGYPGVVVTRYAREDTDQDVEPTRYNLKTLQQSGSCQLSQEWMPPQQTWEAYLAYASA